LSTVQEGKEDVDKMVSQLNTDAREDGVNLVFECCDQLGNFCVAELQDWLGSLEQGDQEIWGRQPVSDMARALRTDIGSIGHRSSACEGKVSKAKSVPKVGWPVVLVVRDFVVRRHFALETGSTWMRINEASHFLLHLFADPIHSQNRQVQVRVG
jgi:hypothetical protein